MPTKKKVRLWKKVVATGVIGASLGLGFWSSKAFYTVTNVIDGDTFETKEGQHVRFDSVNAPELDSCLGKESKEELEKLVLHKKVYIKVTFYDSYQRLVASVFTVDGNVAKKMLEKGLATYSNQGLQKQNDLLEVSRKARDKKVGVYSETCTQIVNPKNSKCNIKANVGDLGRSYRHPGCGQYNNTLVQLHFGDKWFCTETEAKAAGFTKGTDCR